MQTHIRENRPQELEAVNWKTVLVIVAHPDDAEMAMGGTIAKLTNEGKKVILIVATKGELGVNELQKLPPGKLAKIRKREQLLAARILGISEVIFLDYHDQKLSFFQNELVTRLKKLIEDYQPEAVFSWHPQSPYFYLYGQPHPDHAAIGKATIQALKNLSLGNYPECYLFLPPKPSHLVNLPLSSKTLKNKLEALSAHSSQTTQALLAGLQALWSENLVKAKYFTETFTRIKT